MVQPSAAKVGLSTGSVYPEQTAAAFEIAAALGYDGVEVMGGTDPASQDEDQLARLSDEHGVAILAIHSPCLVITQRVWSSEPWVKLKRAQAVAERALDGFTYEPLRDATHFHAGWVNPYWSSSLTRVKQIGGHIFYR